MGEAAFGEADPFTSTDLCKMLGLIDVQFEYNEEDFEYISFEKSFNVRFRQQFQDMNPTASVPVVSDVMSLKYNEFQNMRAGRGKQLASKKVDRIAGSTSNPATSKDLQPTSSGAGSSGQIKKVNMLSGKKVVRFAESTSNPASSKDLQPTSSGTGSSSKKVTPLKISLKRKNDANSNQEFESLLKEDKKVKTKEEHKKERAEAKKNKESEKREKEEKWQKFFEACCDIPTETRKKYASAFVKQRIQPHLLPDLDDLLILEEEEDVYNPTKPILSPAPDRHDIYHIKMPTGESTSKKAKNVLEVDNGTTKTMVVKDASSTLIGRGIVANESAENNRVNLGVEIQNGSKNAKNILEVHNCQYIKNFDLLKIK
ncbi:unnamed protein product [Meloidogyne enterolobii]|uniref:Uncharacterized protein n=1 Tax=Meloidogyne enterolobii TaxID=390850 RepID=A0ACB0YFI2_MELEN